MATQKASSVRPFNLRTQQLDRVTVKEVVFTESAGSAAGVYTGSVVLPPNSVLLDVIVYSDVLWTADTSADMDVGDSADPNGIYAGIDLKATDLAAAESVDFVHSGGLKGADLDTPAAGSHIRRRYLPNTRTISGVVTTVGTVGTAGKTRMLVIYARPNTSTESTFAAT